MTTTSMSAGTSGGTAARSRRPVSQVSIAAGAGALAVIEAYGAIAHAAGVPLRAAAFGAHTATQVNAGWLAARRGPPQTSPLFRGGSLSAASDG